MDVYMKLNIVFSITYLTPTEFIYLCDNIFNPGSRYFSHNKAWPGLCSSKLYCYTQYNIKLAER